MTIGVAIVEDSPDLAAALAALINQSGDIECVGCYGSAEAALDGLARDEAEVVLMDINLPGKSGIECVRELKGRGASPQIIMLTVFEDSERVFESMKAGAVGYLLKRTPGIELLDAIRRVHAGGAAMTGSIARKVVDYFGRSARPLPATLTPREREVLHALSEGQRYKQIAASLSISINTVRKHIRNIYEKLQVNSRTKAVSRYLRR